jgi:hypothetical protein
VAGAVWKRRDILQDSKEEVFRDSHGILKEAPFAEGDVFPNPRDGPQFRFYSALYGGAGKPIPGNKFPAIPAAHPYHALNIRSGEFQQ